MDSLPSRDANLDVSTLIITMDSDFLQWFMGFTDAEGSFVINRLLGKDKKTTSSFTFMFKIALHKDDEMVLKYKQ